MNEIRPPLTIGQAGGYCSAFSPDGLRIVSGSTAVRVWDSRTGDELVKMDGHTSIVSSVSFSTDGSLIVSSSEDMTARVWDSRTGEELHALRFHSIVQYVALSPDKTRLAVGLDDATMRICKMNGDELIVLEHDDGLTSVAFSPDGSKIVTGSEDTYACVWDSQTGEEVLSLEHEESVYSVAFSANGAYIVTAAGKTISVWDGMGHQIGNTLHGHTGYVLSVAFSKDGLVVSGSDDGTVRVWDPKNTMELLKLEASGSVGSVMVSPDAFRIVSSSEINIQVWNLRQYSRRMRMKKIKAVRQRKRDAIRLRDLRMVRRSEIERQTRNIPGRSNISTDDCAICQEPLSIGSVVRRRCGHAFHEICIREWSSRSDTCPMCRKKGNKINALKDNIYYLVPRVGLSTHLGQPKLS